MVLGVHKVNLLVISNHDVMTRKWWRVSARTITSCSGLIFLNMRHKRHCFPLNNRCDLNLFQILMWI